jgi:large subunit ribosomal protein L7/L12
MAAMTTSMMTLRVSAKAPVKASNKVAFGAPSKAMKASFVRPKAVRKGVVAMSASTDDIIEKMKTLTLLEASELVKQIEETFGVDASAPAGGMVMAAGPGGGGAEEAAEKTEFDLVITDVDASKRIAIIKVVRGLTSLGLKEAKDAVTNLPFTILEGKTKGECEEAMKTLEEGGAKAEMK